MFNTTVSTIRTLPFRYLTLNLLKFSEKMSEINIVRKPRYDGRMKKRQWEERRTDKGAAFDPTGNTTKKIRNEQQEIEITDNLIEKIKRRKFALLLGYSGTNYYGMQRNPNMKTIEEELFVSLLKNQYINDENFQQVQTMQYQRAARTDKGVSAARQVVSLKLPENIEIEKINEHLPEVVRLFAIKRVTKGFNSKGNCDGRSYFYLLPTIAFLPFGLEMKQKGFRLDAPILQRIEELLLKFVGTKNFHNFTSKKKPNDPSAKRFIKSFTCNKPFVKDDVEFIVLTVQGQSFMLHQIRKMIGLLIAIIKGYTPIEVFEQAFTMEKVCIPRAPGLGLVLDYVHYDRYNNRYGNDGIHEKLVWDEAEQEVNEFKENHIYPTIINTEIKEESMINWIIEKLSLHKYDDFRENEDDDDDDDDKSDNEKVSVKNT